MSTFDPTWPTGLVNLDVDYQQGNLNSTQLDTTMDENHFKFSNQTANNGKHRYIQLPTDLNPGGSTTSSEILLYNGLDGTYNFYFIPPNTAVPAGGIQMTRNEKPLAAQNGFSWMPGGVLIKWGRLVGAPIANGAAVNFNAIGPAFTNVFSCTLGGITTDTNDKTINIATLAASGFTVRTSSSSQFQQLCWMAIGN